MSRNSELIKKRDEDLRKRYSQYIEKYPHWRTWFVIRKLAEEFYLTESTVEYILFKKQDDS